MFPVCVLSVCSHILLGAAQHVEDMRIYVLAMETYQEDEMLSFKITNFFNKYFFWIIKTFWCIILGFRKENQNLTIAYS